MSGSANVCSASLAVSTLHATAGRLRRRRRRGPCSRRTRRPCVWRRRSGAPTRRLGLSLDPPMCSGFGALVGRIGVAAADAHGGEPAPGLQAPGHQGRVQAEGRRRLRCDAAGSGAVDIRTIGNTLCGRSPKLAEAVLRKVGFAAWYRPFKRGPHLHAVAISDPDLSTEVVFPNLLDARDQVAAYAQRRDGLKEATVAPMKLDRLRPGSGTCARASTRVALTTGGGPDAGSPPVRVSGVRAAWPRTPPSGGWTHRERLWSARARSQPPLPAGKAQLSASRVAEPSGDS